MWRKVKVPKYRKGERGGSQERSDAIVRACRLVSRRRLLTAVAAAAVSVAAGRSGAIGQDKPNGGSSRGVTSPHFDPGGPDAIRYGQGEAYPVPDAITARAQGNPWGAPLSRGRVQPPRSALPDTHGGPRRRALGIQVRQRCLAVSVAWTVIIAGRLSRAQSGQRATDCAGQRDPGRALSVR